MTLYVTGSHIKPGIRSQIEQVFAYVAPPQLSVKLAQADLAHPGGGYPCVGALCRATARCKVSLAPAWLDVWHPGEGAKLLPTGTGIQVEPGSTIILQIHYSAAEGTSLTDFSAIDLQVSNTVQQSAALIPFTNNAWSVAGAGSLYIGMGAPEVTLGHSGDLFQFANFVGANLDIVEGQPVYIHGAGVHMNRLGVAGRVSLRRSNGAEDCLIDVPSWEFDWRKRHAFLAPKIVNVGDKVELVCTWDNSQGNQPYSDGFQPLRKRSAGVMVLKMSSASRCSW